MNILITGANQGIGFFMAKELLRVGNKVTILDIDTSLLGELKETYGDSLLPITCNVCSDEEIQSAVNESTEKFGGVDIAIHNACICTFDSLENTPIDTYKQVADVNFFGALRLTKAVIPAMKKAGKGRILFVSSGVGVTGFYNISPYASSKGAIESLAKSLYQEYKNTGITFQLIHPPLTQTKSASPLPVPKEIKANPEKVGVGLAKRINKKSFVLCHSFGQKIQMNMSYLFPLKLGAMMTMMTKRTQK